MRANTQAVRLLCIATVAMPLTASMASDTNYQTYPIGNRAMGMGGAFTAFGDDAGGEFYNPAGLALLTGLSGSVSQSAYSLQSRKLSGAIDPTDADVQGQDLSDIKIPVIPTALSFSFKFGRKVEQIKRFTAGYSMFVPQASDFSFTGILDYQKDGEPQQLRIDLFEEDRTLQHGPTLAMRINPQWSLGLSVFHLYRTQESYTGGYGVAVPQGDDGLTEELDTLNSLVKRTVHSFLFKLGVRYDPTRNWRFGLAITPPSIRLLGEGSIDLTNASLTNDPSCTGSCARFRAHIESGDSAKSELPLQVRVGAGYTTDSRNFTGSMDVSIHTPSSYFPYANGDLDDFKPDLETGTIPAGFAPIGEIRRSMVVNVNVGAEYYLADWLFRGGFYTNFSAAETIGSSPFAMPSDVDMYGVSLAVGHRWGAAMVSVGAIYAFGSGQGSSVQGAPPDGPAENVFGPISERRDFVFLFLQGASVAADKAAAVAKEIFTGPSKEKPASPKSPQ